MGNLWQLLQQTYARSVDGRPPSYRFCLEMTYGLLVDLLDTRI